MKRRLIFFGCCLLLLGGFHAAAQDYTAPLPPPEADSSPLPGPGESAPAAPARGSASGSASSGSAARSTARSPAQSTPARSAPARSTPARSAAAQPATAQPAEAAQEGIPSKGMFWGFKIGGSYDWYSMKKNLRIDGHGKEAEGGGFNAGLLLGYDFGLLALQGEVLINRGWNGYNYYNSYNFPYGSEEEHLGFDMTALQIPVMLKLDLHWRRIMFQPQVGFYLNFGLGDMRYNHDSWESYYGSSSYVEDNMDYSSPLFGFMAGGAFGVRIGRGYLFLDIRYAGDLGNIKIKAEGIEIKRHAVMSALGYQYYFRSRQ